MRYEALKSINYSKGDKMFLFCFEYEKYSATITSALPFENHFFSPAFFSEHFLVQIVHNVLLYSHSYRFEPFLSHVSYYVHFKRIFRNGKADHSRIFLKNLRVRTINFAIIGYQDGFDYHRSRYGRISIFIRMNLCF